LSFVGSGYIFGQMDRESQTEPEQASVKRWSETHTLALTSAAATAFYLVAAILALGGSLLKAKDEELLLWLLPLAGAVITYLVVPKIKAPNE
jgi:hypothetical protein